MLSLWILAACASWGGPTEIKMMIAPSSQTQLIRELQLAPSNVETEGLVYFLDNSARQLLAAGVLVRARLRAKDADLTVKVRPAPRRIEEGSWGSDFECELDVAGSGTSRSCSEKQVPPREILSQILVGPRSQREWRTVLSPTQLKLVSAVTGSVWQGPDLWIFGPLQETKWKLKLEGMKLTVDRWVAPSGSTFFEVSMKSKESRLREDRAQLRDLLRGRGIQVLEGSDNKSETLLKSPEFTGLWH